MVFKKLGLHFNIPTIVISLIVGGIIACHTFCGCLTIKKEGFLANAAPLDYRMGVGVPNDTWTSPPPVTPSAAHASMYAPLAGNSGGKVPLADDQMFFFYDNKFTPDCCYKPQQYSSSTGCACISVEQMKYLSSRGGNNTIP